GVEAHLRVVPRRRIRARHGAQRADGLFALVGVVPRADRAARDGLDRVRIGQKLLVVRRVRVLDVERITRGQEGSPCRGDPSNESGEFHLRVSPGGPAQKPSSSIMLKVRYAGYVK